MKAISFVFVFLLSGIGVVAHAAPPPLSEVVRALRRYNQEDTRLQGAKETTTKELVQHWKQLTAIRSRLESVRTSPAPAAPSSIALRHELAELFGSAAGVAGTRGDYVADTVTGAAEKWKGDVLAIAHWANSHFDFELQEVLGMPLY